MMEIDLERRPQQRQAERIGCGVGYKRLVEPESLEIRRRQ
jgi:hypothetical protein